MKLISIYLLSILFILFSSCKEDPSSSDPDPTPSDPNVNKYFVELPAWDIFCPQVPDEDTQSDPTAEWECATQTIETTTPCSITRTPEEIVTYDPGSEILYVGSLIQGDGYMGGLGSIKSLPIYERAPITVTIDATIPDPNRVVENPNLATVTQAVNELKIAAQNSGYQTSSSISYNYKTSYSVNQLAISLGLSAKFMKGKAKIDLNAGWTHDRRKSTVAAYFIQKMFTISIQVPQRPGDFFSSDFTRELLDEQISFGNIGPDNLPVYVSNIVYGRMMLFTMTSTHSADSMGLALDARRKNISGQIDIKYQNIIDNSTFTITTIGGNADDALAFIRSGQSGDFFENNPDLTTGVQISYTLRHLKPPFVVAKVSETTSYDMVQYEPISVATYTSEGAWNSAVQSKMSYQKWECNWDNVLKADEHASFQNGGSGQWFLGKRITFNGSNTGYPFNFELEAMDGAIPPGEMKALVFNDNEGGSDFDNVISIGDVDDYDNDDFEIRVSGSAKVYAIAFIMLSNTTGGGEFLQVFAEDVNNNECEIEYVTDGINGFFGVISPVPIKRIWFDERAGGDDDIALGDLFFGYKQ